MNGVQLPTLEDDSDSDEDSDADGAPRDNETASAAVATTTTVTVTADEDAATSSASLPSSPARSRLRHIGGGTSDSDREIDAPHPSSDDASLPPSSSPDRDRDEAAIELDALLEAETAHNATSTTGHAWKGASNDDAIAMDEDEDLWDALSADTGAVAVATSAPAKTPAPPAVDDDDQEMWDIMQELEQERAKETAAHQPDTIQLPPPPAASVMQPETETDYLDDLYL